MCEMIYPKPPSNCPKCGAEYKYPFMWHGILPPPPQKTCACPDNNVVITTDGTGNSPIINSGTSNTFKYTG